MAFALSTCVLAFCFFCAVSKNFHDKTQSRQQMGSSDDGSGSKQLATSAKGEDVQQQLLICNAYASPDMLEITHVQTIERLTGGEPLNYKECRQFVMSLTDGDQLDFTAANVDIGTFYATALPKTKSSLLLIPHRRSQNSMAIGFESHAFDMTEDTQIAVVDAYKGSSSASVQIADADGKSKPEALQFSSVVAVHPGKYTVSLNASSSAGVPLLAGNQVNYVVIRVGSASNDTIGSRPYPEELLVFASPASSMYLCLTSFVVALCAILLHLS
jgi:hypothetical protein